MTAAKIRPDTEMCAPAEGPITAYAGQRAVDRFTAVGEKRHAVTLLAVLAGTLDAECGTITMVEVGPWDPEDPLNCRKCAKYVAGLVPMPPDLPRPVPTPAPAPVRVPVEVVRIPLPRRRTTRPGPGQLGLTA